MEIGAISVETIEHAVGLWLIGKEFQHRIVTGEEKLLDYNNTTHIKCW